jgi:hypothetical protein
MLIATRNKGDANGFRERPLDRLKFSEPTNPAARTKMMSRISANSPIAVAIPGKPGNNIIY